MHDSPQAEINKMNNILHNEVEVKKTDLNLHWPQGAFVSVCLSIKGKTHTVRYIQILLF